jgi:hypothetical protein
MLQVTLFLRRNTLTLHHSEPLDLNAAFRELSQLVEVYATKQTLPSTVAAAFDEVHSMMKEIEMCQLEGHMLDHHDIPWRVGYLVFCMHHVERVNQRDQSARLLVTQFLDDMGVSLACALEIALVRLRSLNKGEDIVHVDTHVLVPIMKRHLAHRA